MKRILMLIPALNAGGSERVIATLANEWSLKYDVTILTYAETDSFYDLKDSVKHEKMDLMPPSHGFLRKLAIPFVEVKRLLYILKKARTNEYSFVLAFTNTANVFASLIKLIRHKQKVVISERAAPDDYSRIMKLILKRLYRIPDILVCQNEAVHSYFNRMGFKNRLVVLPNPLDFSNIPSERPQVIKKEIVTVGRLTAQKNHRILIDAFSEIVKAHSEYTLKIYGEGPLKTELESHIKKLGLMEKVKLMGTRKEVMKYVNESSVFILPSDFEGFPNVLIEAMATGLPVISSDFSTGVARTLINDGDNGYLFNVNDKQSLIDAMSKLLDRETQFIEIGQRNKEIASKYEAKKVALQWLEMIE